MIIRTAAMVAWLKWEEPILFNALQEERDV
jgi:hypothetical protein